ncbi:MAG: N-acetylmuramoyl-L-alanine amidase [Clostridia bacterium]|nr:N-acetylmuramoyl-L-alanine amidase [Clostridia bacterium]
MKNLKNKFFICQISVFIIFTILLSYLSQANYLFRDNDVDAFANQNSKFTVIIDAGHGGEDCGAIGINGVYEKDLNMQISLKLGEYLEAAGFEVIYTRTDDALLYSAQENIKGMRKISDLKNRVKICNSYDNALFVSIHMNSFGSENCSGLQVYYSPDSENARSAAISVQDNVKSKLQPTNKRSVKSGENIYVLENSENPAILIECGFISNSGECKKLSEKEYQKELSFAILCGIIEYEKSKK